MKHLRKFNEAKDPQFDYFIGCFIDLIEDYDGEYEEDEVED